MSTHAATYRVGTFTTSTRGPPMSLLLQVCECVVILKNLKDVSWAGAKAMMADTGFLKGLVEFDKDSLSEKQVRRHYACMHTLASGCTCHSMKLAMVKGSPIAGHPSQHVC